MPVFITSFGEVSLCLTYVRFTTVWPCQYVYSGSWKCFVFLGFGSNVFLDSVFRETGYLHICVFKYFSDICGFLANIGKCSPFFFWGGGYFYLWVFCLFLLDFLIFHGWIGKELLYGILWITFFAMIFIILGYVSGLWYSNLIAAYLCWVGRME